MAHIELPKDAEGREIPLDTGTLYKKNGIAKYIYSNGAILQFVACSSCGAFGDVGLMDAVEARNRWNRGPIQIRAEVA